MVRHHGRPSSSQPGADTPIVLMCLQNFVIDYYILSDVEAYKGFSNYCDSDHYHEDSLCDRSCERNRHNVTPALAPHHFPAMGCAVGAPELLDCHGYIFGV